MGAYASESTAEIVLRPADPADLGPLLRLLEGAGLPLVGVEESVDRFVVAEAGDGIVGVAGLERHGGDGVLRSVAVDSSVRGQGLGARLTERIIDGARRDGLRRLYLLTTTADSYFPRHGFRRIERAEAAQEVRNSVEFREACPASAVTMVLDLD